MKQGKFHYSILLEKVYVVKGRGIWKGVLMIKLLQEKLFYAFFSSFFFWGGGSVVFLKLAIRYLRRYYGYLLQLKYNP